MKFAVFTLGCRLNFAETEEIVENLLKNGHKISFSNPDVYIIRGCSVTQKAEKETRQKIREVRKKNKKTIIVAAGCLKDDFSLPKTDLILTKKKEFLIFKKIKEIDRRFKFPLEAKEGVLLTQNNKLRTRSFLKIQDGCQNFCAYCLVPLLRNKKISVSSRKIVDLIKEREKAGYQEVVLTGVNIGKWQEKPATTETQNGSGFQKSSEIQSLQGKFRDLVWLIKEILARTNIPRIRISSLWPTSLNDGFLTLFRNLRLCQHLHLSLQSLSDSVLRRMRRYYTFREIGDRIKKIKKTFPDLSLTADIIVGFPGETQKEFQKTVKNLKELGLAKIHIFRYSLRPETRASLAVNQVSEKIKKERANVLLKLSKDLEKKWRQKFLDKKRPVLFEEKKGKLWQGLTDNYLKVFVKSQKNLSNQILPVRLEKLYRDGIIGKL